MSRRKREKNPKRFYLLPGQGGNAYRRKQRIILAWSLIVALVVSGILGAVMYVIGRNP